MTLKIGSETIYTQGEILERAREYLQDDEGSNAPNVFADVLAVALDLDKDFIRGAIRPRKETR